MTSRNLSLRRPRIGYARLVVAGNSPNQSQGMDINSVIRLGHSASLPLMCLLSELADGLEPHDLIYSPASSTRSRSVEHGGGEGVPGVV